MLSLPTKNAPRFFRRGNQDRRIARASRPDADLDVGPGPRSFKIPMICSSLNRPFLMRPLLSLLR